MNIKILHGDKGAAYGQVYPFERCAEELRVLGYNFVETVEDAEVIMVQTHWLRDNLRKDKFIEYCEGGKTVIYLDSCDGATMVHEGHIRQEGVVFSIKKQILDPTDLYKKTYPKKRYHYGLMDVDTEEKVGVNKHYEVTLQKVRLGWNLGLCPHLDPTITSWSTERDIDIHSSFRITSGGDEFYNHHRGACHDSVLRICEKHSLSQSGTVSGKEYHHAMKRSKICISPWGMGEICYREFEAMRYGTVVIKPKMDFVNTWPRIGCVYTDPNWNVLEDVIMDILENYFEYSDKAREAYHEYCNAWDKKEFAVRFDTLMKENIG